MANRLCTPRDTPARCGFVMQKHAALVGTPGRRQMAWAPPGPGYQDRRREPGPAKIALQPFFPQSVVGDSVHSGMSVRPRHRLIAIRECGPRTEEG